MATFRTRAETAGIPGWIIQMHSVNNRLATPHIYRAHGRWLVLFGPQADPATVNKAMSYVWRTFGESASPVRW